MPKIVVDLSALRRNAKKAARFSRLCAVVKADAYGAGALPVARALEDIADRYAVATEKEADELLHGGIEKDILILGKSFGFDFADGADRVIHTVSSEAEIRSLCGKRLPRVAIKLNTGMNRYGADPSTFPSVFRFAQDRSAVDSVYSHLRNASDRVSAEAQLAVFRQTDGLPVRRHLAATGGIGLGNAFAFDFVRCGIGLYGGADGFENVMTVTAPVLEVRELHRGEGVGYGSAVLDGDARIAVVGIGYADGYRRLSAPRYLWAGGKRCAVVAVCMDVCMAAVGANVRAGDTAELVGKHIPVTELAESYGTISYEVMTSWGRRVERQYEQK